MRKLWFGVIPAVVAAAVAGTVLIIGGDRPVSSDDPTTPPPRGAVMGTVTGVVTSGAGRPVVGAAVLPKSLDEPSAPIPELAVTTDAAGRYSWRLRPGRYELTVREGQSSATQPVTVTAGKTTTVDIALR